MTWNGAKRELAEDEREREAKGRSGIVFPTIDGLATELAWQSLLTWAMHVSTYVSK